MLSQIRILFIISLLYVAYTESELNASCVALSSSLLGFHVEGLDKLTDRIVVTMYSNKSTTLEEFLFCAWINRTLQSTCNSTKQGYTYLGMHNETIIIGIDEREERTHFRVTLHMSDIHNFDCVWPVKGKEPQSTYPTGPTAPDANMSPAPKNKGETNQNADHKVAIGLGLPAAILVLVLAGIAVYKFRESIGTAFRNVRRYLNGMWCERSRDLEQGLHGASAGSIEANNGFVNDHVQNASSNSALPSSQNGTAEQLAREVEADGITTPATGRNGTGIPQDIDQNIEDSRQACGTEDNDLERAHTSAQSVSSPESTPLLPKVVIEKEPSGASTGLQDDRDQLMTDDAKICTAAMPDISTTGSDVSDDDEGSPEDGFEQFDDKDLEEAKQNNTTETPHNETQAETGFMHMFRSIGHSWLGSNTAKQPEHALDT